MNIIKSRSIITMLVLTALISCLLSACGNSTVSITTDEDLALKNAEQGSEIGRNSQTNVAMGDGTSVSGGASDDTSLTGTSEDMTALTMDGTPDPDLQGINGAVFNSNGRLYVYDVKNGCLDEIDKASGKKSFLGLSPDKSMAAWSYSIQTPDMSSTARKIGIYHIMSRKTTELSLDDTVYQIMSISWTSDKTIMAVGHLNPSTEMYQAFDAITGRSLFVKPVGRLYDISADGNRIMYYFTPHFSEMMPSHIRISGIDTDKALDDPSENSQGNKSEGSQEKSQENVLENSPEDISGDGYFDEPVYMLDSPEDEIKHACFVGDDKLVLLEYRSPGVYLLKFANINENSIDIVTEFELNNVNFDPADILSMEYMADRSELYVVSSDTDDAEPGSVSINLHVLGIRNSEIISEEIIPSGFDADKLHDISINAVVDQVYINDALGSGDKASRRTFRVEDGKLVQTSSADMPGKTFEALRKALNKLLGGNGDIDQIQVF